MSIVIQMKKEKQNMNQQRFRVTTTTFQRFCVEVNKLDDANKRLLVTMLKEAVLLINTLYDEAKFRYAKSIDYNHPGEGTRLVEESLNVQQGILLGVMELVFGCYECDEYDDVRDVMISTGCDELRDLVESIAVMVSQGNLVVYREAVYFLKNYLFTGDIDEILVYIKYRF